VFHVKVQTTRISIRDDFIEISLGNACSLSEEVLVRIKVREMFDHFASPTLESIQSYLKTAGKAFVSHSLLIRGDSQCVWSTFNALPLTNRLHKHPPTCMEEHRLLVMNLENNHVEFCWQHVPVAIHFLFRIHCGLVIVSRGGPGGGIIRHRESGTPVTGCAGSPSASLVSDVRISLALAEPTRVFLSDLTLRSAVGVYHLGFGNVLL